MKLSEIFTKTIHQAPKDEKSINARLLIRAGFIYKNSAGVYSFLPLGWRVIQKIIKIIRNEMLRIKAQEIFMPSLTQSKLWQRTGRENINIAFKILKSENILAWTHEEVLSEIVSKYITSYNDLDFAVYQIQTKFRNEPRSKSGLLRTREFIMKDLYSFHRSEENLFKYYETVKEAYLRIFKNCDLKPIFTLAGGGVFTLGNTHEFQVLSDVGEDTILVCSKCEYAENIEISKLKEGKKCQKCQGIIIKKNSIEVGNIFPLGDKYSRAFNLKFNDKDGIKKFVVMGSYGIGVGRLMGAVVETHNDQKGIIWPESIAPFKVHLISLDKLDKEGDKIYKILSDKKIEVLYDDFKNKSAGEKFIDADLIGCPIRLVISKKTLSKNKLEIKMRKENKTKLINIRSLINYLK